MSKWLTLKNDIFIRVENDVRTSNDILPMLKYIIGPTITMYLFTNNMQVDSTMLISEIMRS